MKRLFMLLALGAWMSSACSKDDDNIQPDLPSEISFTGNWTRQFEAGSGNLHTVLYAIHQDSMRYTLSGPVGNADYVMLRDTFILEDNRFIGHTPEGQHYLIFVKNISSDSITIYKQEIANVDEGLSIAVPDDNTTANHGWNIYYKE